MQDTHGDSLIGHRCVLQTTWIVRHKAAMNDRARQKKIERQKKKRLMAQRQARVTSSSEPSMSSLLRLAPSLPFGPTMLSHEWRNDDLTSPACVSAVITRQLPDGDLLVAMLFIDRTCFGVKSTMTKVMSLRDLQAVDETLKRLDQKPMETVPAEIALSVVWHAIDFARSLGFELLHGFPEAIVGRRPDVLVDTPLSKPERPVFVPGPHDDLRSILSTLSKIHKGDELAMGQALIAMGFTPDVLRSDDDDDFDCDSDSGSDDGEESSADTGIVVDLA
jgi:hypothetical protein